MPAFAPAALATAVALSALGAIVLCVLVVLYGFPADDDDSLEQATRRLVLTRVGHALAATCFTATAILIATVLVQRAPPPAAPVPPPDSQVPALDERVTGQEARLSETEARIRELQDALRRREAAPVQPAPAASPPTPPAASPAPPPVSISAPVPAPSPSPPIAAAAPHPARPPEAASAPSAPRSTPRQALDVPGKLREDWREIQRGVDSAGDDFRSAVQGLRRRLLGQ